MKLKVIILFLIALSPFFVEAKRLGMRNILKEAAGFTKSVGDKLREAGFPIDKIKSIRDISDAKVLLSEALAVGGQHGAKIKDKVKEVAFRDFRKRLIEGDASGAKKVLDVLDKLEIPNFDINSKNSEGKSFLVEAFEYRLRVTGGAPRAEASESVIMFLLNFRNIDVDVKVGEKTLLESALLTENPEIVEILVRKKELSPEGVASDGRSFFYHAMNARKQSILPLMEALLSGNPGFFTQTTVLHDAITLNKPEVLSMLINSKAHLNTKNAQGETPLDVARRLENKQAEEILTSFGAKTAHQVDNPEPVKMTTSSSENVAPPKRKGFLGFGSKKEVQIRLKKTPPPETQ